METFNIYGDFEKCPVCGCDNSHINYVEENDTLSSNNQRNVSIHFYGECNHKWIQVFSGHKGNVSRGTIIIEEKYRCIKGE